MELVHQHHVLLWIGGGFRMPLMIGLSGYLVNVDRTRNDTASSLLRRYTRRMLLPWAFAVIVYMVVGDVAIGWSTPIDLLLRPPFHLWYVPALFFLILVTRLLPFSPLTLLAIGTPVSLAIMVYFGLEHGPIGATLLSPDSRYLRYFVYFFLGMVMAERGLPTSYVAAAMLAAILGLWWWISLYGSDTTLAFVPARLLMCMGMIGLLPAVSTLRLFWAPLNAIGRDSLFFYLWHPLIMGIILLTGADGPMTLFVSVLCLILFSRFAGRVAVVGQLTGSISSNQPPLTGSPQAAAAAV